jgi:hypothetical protein
MQLNTLQFEVECKEMGSTKQCFGTSQGSFDAGEKPDLIMSGS